MRTNVLVNEVCAHHADPMQNFVELYNYSATDVDVAGCWITDDPATNKFRIPVGTQIGARGFLSWDQNQLGFSLSAAGESLYLVNSNATRVLDAVRFGGGMGLIDRGLGVSGRPRHEVGWRLWRHHRHAFGGARQLQQAQEIGARLQHTLDMTKAVVVQRDQERIALERQLQNACEIEKENRQTAAAVEGQIAELRKMIASQTPATMQPRPIIFASESVSPS
jgi:hypothetical protein